MKNIVFKLAISMVILLVTMRVQGQDLIDNTDSLYIEKERLFQVTFVPNIGMSSGSSEKYINNYSLNILVGHEYGFRGLEIGGLYNQNISGSSGLQIGGMANVIQGKYNGGQISGAVNVASGPVTGVQISGVINVADSSSIATQVSGGVNIVNGQLDGAQLAGIINISKRINGAQVSGGVNIVESLKGVQFTGIGNISSDSISGIQVAGLFNRAHYINGWQVGLINVADSLTGGASLGLLNLIKNGVVNWAVENNEVMDVTLAFRSGSKGFYTIFFASIQAEEEFLWSFGTGLGSQFDFKNGWYGNLELSTQHISDHEHFTNSVNLLNRVGLNIGHSFNRHFEISGGPALNVYVADRLDGTRDQYGHEIDINPFYNKIISDTNVKMWIGYSVAIKF